MTEAQIAAEATLTSSLITAAATIIVALIGLAGVIYQVKKSRAKKNDPSISIKQNVKGSNNTIIGIQSNERRRK